MIVEVDTLVVGAGLVGSSVTMNMAKKGAPSVRAIDFDLEGTLSSSELNAGGVRATWFQTINIEISKLSIEYISKLGADVGYRACGYLWLHRANVLPAALKARDRQIQMGWESESWDAAELRRRVPYIDKTDDVAGAIFAPRDGLINPNLLKAHFRKEARAAGADFDDRTLVVGASYADDGGSVSILAKRFVDPIDEDLKRQVLTGQDIDVPHERVEYRAKEVVNCAGSWAPGLARMLAYHCPSQPVRRQVSLFDSRDIDLSPYGMTIDTTGVYYHPEASYGMAGFANRGEPVGYNYQYDAEVFFNEVIWPALYERSTRFEQLKHVSGWAGLYEMSPDHSAIVGRVESGSAGAYGKIFEAHSFSGHGAMHSYAAGLALSELILLGKYQTIDFAELSGNRFEENRLVKEGLVI